MKSGKNKKTDKMKKLTKEQRKEIACEEYLKIKNTAYEEYLKIENPAYKEYLKIKNTAYEEYDKIKNTAYEEYDKIKNTAYEEYKKKIKEIEDEPEEIPEIIEQNGRKYRLVEK